MDKQNMAVVRSQKILRNSSCNGLNMNKDNNIFCTIILKERKKEERKVRRTNEIFFVLYLCTYIQGFNNAFGCRFLTVDGDCR